MQSDEEINDHPDFKRIKAIMDGDGSEIRRQFIYAGLLLTIFERFTDFVIKRVDEFLSRGLSVKDGKVTFIRGEEFKKIIKEKGSGDPGQHNNKVFRAAIRWLHELNAIEQAELEHVEKLYTLRNDIGHELFRIIADDNKQPIRLVDVVLAQHIYVKVTRWWIKEIEAAVHPDMTQDKYENAQWDEAESLDTMLLSLILQKSLAGDSDWETLCAAARNSA